MDQVKIGKFIAECRKEKGMTQAALAEKLGITDRAVSKWETGKSLPDASIMLDLCGILEIDVNELLTGEHITMDNYKGKAEENLLEMTAKVEKRDKLLLQIEIVMIAVVIILLLVLSFIGSYMCDNGQVAMGTVLIFSPFILLIPIIYFGLKIEHDAGYYECPNCGERYVPTMKEMFWAPHMGWNRKLTCPYCGKKGYHKKVISKNKGEN